MIGGNVDLYELDSGEKGMLRGGGQNILTVVWILYNFIKYQCILASPYIFSQ